MAQEDEDDTWGVVRRARSSAVAGASTAGSARADRAGTRRASAHGGQAPPQAPAPQAPDHSRPGADEGHGAPPSEQARRAHKRAAGGASPAPGADGRGEPEGNGGDFWTPQGARRGGADSSWRAGSSLSAPPLAKASAEPGGAAARLPAMDKDRVPLHCLQSVLRPVQRPVMCGDCL